MSDEQKPFYFTRAEWFALPIALRQKWWTETDYGKRMPSPELITELRNTTEQK